MKFPESDDAEAYFRRELELQPDDSKSYLNMALALERRRRWSEAEALYRRALELTPDDPEIAAHLRDFIDWRNERGEGLKEAGISATERRAAEFSAASEEVGRRLDEGAALEIVGWRDVVSVAAASALGLLLTLLVLVSEPVEDSAMSWVLVGALVLSVTGLIAAGALHVARQRQLNWVRSLINALEATPLTAMPIRKGGNDRERMADVGADLAVHLERAGAFEESRELERYLGGLRGVSAQDAASTVAPRDG
jgi:Tetratricopeptide repeat